MGQGDRFRRKALRRGYKVDEVDDFLDRAEAMLAGEHVRDPLTPADIRDVVFRTRFGGYDEWQVDMHLDRLEREIEDLLDGGPDRGSNGFPSRDAEYGQPEAAPATQLIPRLPADVAPPPAQVSPAQAPMAAPMPVVQSAPAPLPPAQVSPAAPMPVPVPPMIPARASASVSPAQHQVPGHQHQPPGPPQHQPSAPPQHQPSAPPQRPPMPAPAQVPQPAPPPAAAPAPAFSESFAESLPPARSISYDAYAGRHGKADMTVELPKLGDQYISPFTDGDKARVIAMRTEFKPRRFGSGYDPGNVERLFDAVVATMEGRGGAKISDSDLDPAQFELVQGGYFEDEVDRALKEVRDLFARRGG